MENNWSLPLQLPTKWMQIFGSRIAFSSVGLIISLLLRNSVAQLVIAKFERSRSRCGELGGGAILHVRIS